MKLENFFCIPQRAILAIMGFLALVNAYTMRVVLSVAITAIAVKHNHTNDGPDVAICGKENRDLINFGMSEPVKFKWSEQLQGTILSSFYWGYVIAHIPGGMIADRFGGKWTLSIGILSTALFTIATPVTINKYGSTGLIILRALMGLGEGTVFPTLSVLLSQWVPLSERGKIGSFVYGGGQVGAILGTAVSGLLIHNTGSWEYAFYLWGGVSILWFILFSLLCYSDPVSHPFIKESEREYLQKEVGTIERKTLPPLPVKAIFTSLPVFALIAAQIGHDWGFYIMATDLPKYMADVLQLSIKENGYYSSVPYLVMWITSISSGFMCDYLITRKIMTITASRKFWTILAAIGPAIFIILASYAGCNKMLVVVYFTVCMGLMGCWYAGMKLNSLDLSPNYAGTIMAITNGIGAITGIIVPILIGFLTPNAGLTEWRIVFWITFGVFLVSSVIYGIWGSGDIQPWNDPIKMAEDKKAEK